MNDIYSFLGGAVAALFGVAGLFFLRFWVRTRDGLFVAFAVSFLLLAVSQTLVSLTPMLPEERSPLYLLRLLAFVVIIMAIWRKNRR